MSWSASPQHRRPGLTTTKRGKRGAARPLQARTRVAGPSHVCSSVVLGLDGHPNGYAMMVPTVLTTSAPVPRVMVSFASLFPRSLRAGWLGVWACMGLSPCRPYWVFRACCVCVYVCVCALLGNLGHLWARLGHSKRVLELPYRTTFAPPSSWDWTTIPMG